MASQQPFVIVGLGSAGRRHLANLQALGVSSFALLRTGKSTLPDAELDGLPSFSNVNDCLALKPKAAVIANPTSLHLESAEPFIKAGVPLYLEKPIAHTNTYLNPLTQAIEAAKLPVAVGFQFRFHPLLRQIKAWLQNQAIGKPINAQAYWGEYLPGFHPWEDYQQSYSARADLGGGVILTLCHPLDYMTWLLGDVDSVSAEAGRQGLGLEVEDTAFVLSRFRNGAIATINLDFIRRHKAQTLSITGTEGTIEWDNQTGIATLHRTGSESPQVFSVPADFNRNAMFMAQMSEFIHHLDDPSRSLSCTWTDGVRCQHLIAAIKEACREGKRIYVPSI